MELNEFVRLDPDKIRRDKGLMQLYVNFYGAAFSVLPNCAGCSFKKGFNKLKRYASGGEKIINFEKNNTKMEKTFILKKQQILKIHSYKKDGKMVRVYGYNMTEEFANELVKSGKSDIFAKLPETQAKAEAKKEQKTGYDAMDYRSEILPLYNEIKDRTGKTAEGKKKTDIIKFLQANEG